MKSFVIGVKTFVTASDLTQFLAAKSLSFLPSFMVCAKKHTDFAMMQTQRRSRVDFFLDFASRAGHKKHMAKITTKELAYALGVCVGTIGFWRHLGRGPRGQIAVGGYIYDTDEVEAWIEESGWTPPPVIPDGVLSAKEAADFLGVKRTTFDLWRHRGKGPPWKKVGRRVFYDKGELDRWVEDVGWDKEKGNAGPARSQKEEEEIERLQRLLDDKKRAALR